MMTTLEKMNLIESNNDAHNMAEAMMSNPRREMTITEITDIVFKRYFK